MHGNANDKCHASQMTTLNIDSSTWMSWTIYFFIYLRSVDNGMRQRERKRERGEKDLGKRRLEGRS